MTSETTQNDGLSSRNTATEQIGLTFRKTSLGDQKMPRLEGNISNKMFIVDQNTIASAITSAKNDSRQAIIGKEED